MQAEVLFSEGLFALASGEYDDAVDRLRAVRSRAQESGDALAASRAYLALIAAGRLSGDPRAEGADLGALQRAAHHLPGGAFDNALRLASSRRLTSLTELDDALAELGGPHR